MAPNPPRDMPLASEDDIQEPSTPTEERSETTCSQGSAASTKNGVTTLIVPAAFLTVFAVAHANILQAYDVQEAKLALPALAALSKNLKNNSSTALLTRSDPCL